MPRDKAHMTPAQLANLRPFPKGNNFGGNKPDRVKQLLKAVASPKKVAKAFSLTVEEVNTIEQAIPAMNLATLQKVAKDDNSFAYLKTLALAAIIDMKNGRTTTMDKLRDRQYGTVTKSVDVTSGGNPIAPGQTLSQAEAVALLKELEGKY